MGIKLGNIDAKYIKVGSDDCKVYLGDTLLYPNEQPKLKLYATYSDSTSYSAECDSSTELTSGDTRPNGYAYTAMTSVVIGDCITQTGVDAFNSFSSLSSVTMNDNITIIGRQSFAISGLHSLDIPNSVTTIGDSAFGWCSSLTSVNIGSGITSIGAYAFAACPSLTSITINATTPPTLTNISTVFSQTNNCLIYVPAQSVKAYKSAWNTYRTRIKAIPNS